MERTKAKEKPLCMSERERVHQVIQLMGPKCVPLCLVSEARVEGKFTLCSPRAASTNQNRAKVSRRTRGPMGSEHSSLQLFSPLHFLSFLHDDEAEAEGTERRKKVTISRSRHNWTFQKKRAVLPDWTIYWTLGHFLKPLVANNLPKSPTILGNFCKGIKVYHFSCEIIFGQFL